MAFGFLGDIVEEIGEVILPRGTRGATLGALAGAATGTGAATGAVLGSGLSSAIASGSRGQEAVASPTPKQSPRFAPENAMSSSGFPSVYQPRFAGVSIPRLPPQIRDIGAGIGAGEMIDMIPDINITKFFGDACDVQPKKIFGITADGCKYTITRKQQRALRVLLQYRPIEQIAADYGIPISELAMLAAKQFPARRKGISGAQLSNAKRVNNQILNMAGKLGYNVTPKTKAQLNCK